VTTIDFNDALRRSRTSMIDEALVMKR